MKILAIRGKDLTSLAGEFEVDFDAEPLASAGIFAITGPTGAGKSTLLDAVCLALFNDVPRLGSVSSGHVGTSGGEMLTSSDPRALLRHRAGEGFAEVDFVGLDGSRYRARWSVRRARGRPDGALQQVVQTLVNLDTGDAMGGTRTETLAEIRRLIGLTAHQFGRAVMLAQGEFNAFIDADANTRAELLEKLTGTQLYARLGAAARLRADSLRQGITAIEVRISAQNGLDDIARAVAEESLAEARRLHGAAAGDLAARARDRDWHVRAGELARLVEVADGERAASVERRSEAEPRRLDLARKRLAHSAVPTWRASADADAKVAETRARIEVLTAEADDTRARTAIATIAEADAVRGLAEAAAERDRLRPELETAQALDRQLADAEGKLVPLADARAAASAQAAASAGAHASVTAQRNVASGRRDALAEWLDGNQAREALFSRVDDLKADITDRAALAERVAGLDAARVSVGGLIEAARETRDQTATAAAAARDALAAAESASRDAEGAIPAAGEANEIEVMRNALLAIEPRMLTFERATADIGRESAALAANRIELARLEQAISTSGNRLDVIEAELPALRERQEEAARAGALSAAASDNAAARLRETLVDGEPCPVCGAVDHAVAALAGLIDGRAAADAARVAELGASIGALDAERAVLTDRMESDRSRLAATARVVEGGSATIADAEVVLADAGSALEAVLAACDIENDVTEVRSLVSERLAALDARRDRLAAAREAAQSAQRDLDGARIANEGARDAEQEAGRALRDLEIEAAGTAERLAEATSRLGQVERDLDERLSVHFAWRDDRAPLETLERLVEEWRTRRSDLAEIETGMAGLTDAVHRADVVRERDLARLADAEQAEKATSAERNAFVAERASKLGGESVGAVAERLDDAVDAAMAAREDARLMLGRARTDAAGAAARQEEAVGQLALEEADAGRRRETLLRELSEKDLDPTRVQVAAEAGTGELDAEEAALAQLDRAVVAAEAGLLSRVADRDAHMCTEAPAIAVNDLEPALDAACLAEAAAREVLSEAEIVIRQDDTARTATAELRRTLEGARTEAQPWFALDALIGDATGNRFRRYAQGLTLERLLMHANARLAELKPRYSLERAPESEMLVQVIDNDMAGEVRGLPNLSGGERFLVSLALALGLSEMSTGGGLRVESLFIDEGFGSLDSASLGQAIGVLEHLHATGRRVGVISHIDDVKERIAVKIAVSPTSNGTSSIEVVEG